jgi:hypothetical protein
VKNDTPTTGENQMHSHAHNKAYAQIAMAIPWCCVLTVPILILSVFTALVPAAFMGPLASFDHFFHKWLLIPALVLHVLGVLWYFVLDPHKTKKLTILYVSSSVLFLASLLFHFSPLHDELYHSHEKHEAAGVQVKPGEVGGSHEHEHSHEDGHSH